MTLQEFFYLSVGIGMILSGLLCIVSGIILYQKHFPADLSKRRFNRLLDRIDHIEADQVKLFNEITAVKKKVDALTGNPLPDHVLHALYLDLKNEMKKNHDYLQEMIAESRD